ncbi:unnamed protein product [Lactuca virosa]|uniref:NAD(P)-binding domain-containing protein n=1 Tax=Lactuca virosa TaxID=75947 RepID=A0AAU9MPY8_9ASTR|nr:unnamed protein product [Lactuca virosa]
MGSTVCISPAAFTAVARIKPSLSRTRTLNTSISFSTNPNRNFTFKHIFSLSSSSMASSTLHVMASSSTGAASEELDTSSSTSVGANDLLIVGPGVLGRLVAEKWREEHPGCQITGETVTTDHHEELIKIGINPTLKGVKWENKFPYVIFCAPPSRSSDYASDVGEAASLWNGEGSFLFTSSSAPYDRYDNGQCYEDSPVVGWTLHILLLKNRGMHLYYLKQGTIEANPHHLVNLIHYEDAASLSVAILKKKLRSRLFLGCDNHPVSRQQVMDLVAKSGKFDPTFVGFTGTDGPLGKKLDNSKTREELGWEPTYKSFAHFLGETPFPPVLMIKICFKILKNHL